MVVSYLVIILVFSKVRTAKVWTVTQQALEHLLLQMKKQVVAILVVVDTRTLNMGKRGQVVVGYLVAVLVFSKM